MIDVGNGGLPNVSLCPHMSTWTSVSTHP